MRVPVSELVSFLLLIKTHQERNSLPQTVASKPNTDLASNEDLQSSKLAASNSGERGTAEGTRQNWRWYGRDPSLAYIANTIQLFGGKFDSPLLLPQRVVLRLPLSYHLADLRPLTILSASIFWISTICGLPGILPLAGGKGGPEQGARVEGLWVGLYWAPQVHLLAFFLSFLPHLNLIYSGSLLLLGDRSTVFRHCWSYVLHRSTEKMVET